MHDLCVHNEPDVLVLAGEELALGLFFVVLFGMAEERVNCTLALRRRDAPVDERGAGHGHRRRTKAERSRTDTVLQQSANSKNLGVTWGSSLVRVRVFSCTSDECGPASGPAWMSLNARQAACTAGICLFWALANPKEMLCPWKTVIIILDCLKAGRKETF